jgi:hypothetical protein
MNENVFSNKPLILEGSVVEDSKDTITLRLYPGAEVELNKHHCESLEEGTDALTGKSFLRIVLTEDAEIRAVFEPRLMKLAASRDPMLMPFFLGKPYSPGGIDFPDALLGPIGPIGPGGAGIRGCPNSTGKTIGQFRTRSKTFWGWANDDDCVGD